MRKGYSVLRNFSWIENYKLWCVAANSFQVLKYLWYLLIVFSSQHCLYIKERFYIKSWNVFWCRSWGNRYSFTKSKMKRYWELLIVKYKFPRCATKCSGKNTAVIWFFLWKVAISYFWEINDWVGINNLYCLVSCTKSL